MIVIASFFLTLFMGFCGMLIDSNIGLDGNFSVVLAIATMGAFILNSINNRKTK